VYLSLDYVAADSWDTGEARLLQIDGAEQLGDTPPAAGPNVCGNGTYGESGPELVVKKVAHSASSVTIRASSTLNEGATNESFGIDNVLVMIR